MRRAVHLVLLLSLLGGATHVRAGLTDFTDRGKIDFDMVMQLLNPYGTWTQIDGRWAYTPLNHAPPYTNGRWLYTEYGWYWKGTEPHSWATEHYGFWKRGANHVWSWYPTPDWLPQIVEIRATSTNIGWRAAEVDADGNFVEPAADRFAKTDEWTFVSLAQFTKPITPVVIASPEVAAKILDDSAESMHTYVTYRPITRPGPHPADFLVFKPDGMFAPEIENDALPDPKLTTAEPGKPAPVPPVKTAAVGNAALSNAAPSGAVTAAPAPSLATLSDASDNDDASAAATDARQVHYWITMSLPTYWTPRPPNAQPKEIYIYRPEFYQDQDGVERRVGIWLDPKKRSTPGDLQAVLASRTQAQAPPGPLPPGQPARQVSSGDNAFRSPFDESFRPGAGVASPRSSSKGAPSGLGNGPATNAAP
jgi:hypothetical protein